MSRGFYGDTVVSARNNQEDRLRRIRSENAQAFQSFVETETNAGRRPDPMELQRMRWNLSRSAAGSAFGAAALPATTQIQEITRRSNERIDNLVATETNQRLQDTNAISQAAGAIVASMPSASDDELQREFSSQFGEDAAPRIWETVNQRLPEFRTVGFQNEIDRFAQMGVLDRARTRGELSGLLSSLGASQYASQYLTTEWEQRAAAAAAARRAAALQNFVDMPKNEHALLAAHPEMMPLYAERYGFGALSAEEQNQVISAITTAGNTVISDGIITNLSEQGMLTDAAALSTARDDGSLLQAVNTAAAEFGVQYNDLSEIPPSVAAQVGLAESVAYAAQYEARRAQAATAAEDLLAQRQSAVTNLEQGMDDENNLFGNPTAAAQILGALTETGYLPVGGTGEIVRYVEELDISDDEYDPAALAAELERESLIASPNVVRSQIMSDLTGNMPPPGTPFRSFAETTLASVGTHPALQPGAIVDEATRQGAITDFRNIRRAAEENIANHSAAFVGNRLEAQILFDRIDQIIAEIEAMEIPMAETAAASSPAGSSSAPRPSVAPVAGADGGPLRSGVPIEAIGDEHIVAAYQATASIASSPLNTRERKTTIAETLGLDPRIDRDAIDMIDSVVLRLRLNQGQ